MKKKKVCMLGSFSVGKTSLVRRFVDGSFDDKYLTTMGVKISNKSVDINDEEIGLVLWDIHGDDELQRIKPSYLRGTAGYFLVADGSRPESIEIALELNKSLKELTNNAPCIFLLNKSDLKDEWKVTDEQIKTIQNEMTIIKTSAKTGESVESAFLELAKLTIGAS